MANVKPKKVPLVRIDRTRHMFISPPGILSFPHLFTPRAVEENQEPSFSCDLIFDDVESLKVDYKGKKTTTPAVLRAIQNVKMDQWGKDPKKWPRFTLPAGQTAGPVKIGNEKTYDDGTVLQGYADKRYITARSGMKYPPRLFNTDGSPARPEDLYGGCVARVQVLCRPWISTLGLGVSMRLLAVMKVADGEPFGLGGNMFDFEGGGDDEFGLIDESGGGDEFDQIQF